MEAIRKYKIGGISIADTAGTAVIAHYWRPFSVDFGKNFVWMLVAGELAHLAFSVRTPVSDFIKTTVLPRVHLSFDVTPKDFGI